MKCMFISVNLSDCIPCVRVKTKIRSSLICVCLNKWLHVSNPYKPQPELSVVKPSPVVPANKRCHTVLSKIPHPLVSLNCIKVTKYERKHEMAQRHIYRVEIDPLKKLKGVVNKYNKILIEPWKHTVHVQRIIGLHLLAC